MENVHTTNNVISFDLLFLDNCVMCDDFVCVLDIDTAIQYKHLCREHLVILNYS